MNRNFPLLRSQSGMALLMAVFVVAFGSLLVFSFMQEARYDERGARGLAEGIQANYKLKSAVNVAKMILEIPKPPPNAENPDPPNWWEIVNQNGSFPLPGLEDARVYYSDEDAKIDLNAIVPIDTTPANVDKANFWLKTLAQLFTNLGFVREKYDQPERTLGDASFSPADQAYALRDWIDKDSENFSMTGLDGGGTESGAPKGWYQNKVFSNIFDVLLVPGMTAERLRLITPYVRTSAKSSNAKANLKINFKGTPFNQKDLDVIFTAMGLGREVIDNLHQRPLDFSKLQSILPPEVKDFAKTESNEYGIYIRVTMPNVTKWLRAVVTKDTNSGGFEIKTVEYY